MTKNNCKNPSLSSELEQSEESFVDKLLRELSVAQNELVTRHEITEKQKNPFFVIAKLMSNLDKNVWEEVRKSTLSEGWCALEFNPQSNFAKASLHVISDEEDDTVHSPQMMEHLLLTNSFFKQLEQEIVRSKRTNTFVTLVQFAVRDAQVDLEEVTRILFAAIKFYGADCDCLGVLDTNIFALILPGANAFKAQVIVEDVLTFCQGKGLQLHVGIASHVGTEGTLKDFLEHAHMALLEAQHKQKVLCIYKKPSKTHEDRQTLVHSHEKRFLFGDSDEV